MAIDLHIRIARGDDDRLSGTVRTVDADEVRPFSGTLELLHVFEDLLAEDTRPALRRWLP
ncbi:MAG TPA: hypothetical protein VGG07_03610 [Solirubrobacteraceae bacterium]|jgi:hypothetical protein